VTRRRAATVRGRGYRWRQVRRIALGIHVQLYGWTCPGWGVPAHHSYDLTGDHALPLAAGGLSTPANVCSAARATAGRARPWSASSSCSDSGSSAGRGRAKTLDAMPVRDPTPVSARKIRSRREPMAPDPAAQAQPCGACGKPTEPSRGPRRRLCLACAGPAEYQRRWLARRPDYRDGYNVTRRVHHEPRACAGCALVFTPRRSDARYCCKRCGDQLRTYGPWTLEGATSHRATHPPGEVPGRIHQNAASKH
jgi:hypothetical protein